MMKNPLDYNISALNNIDPKKGRLLIAEPFMTDPYFKRAVVLLTGYEKEGVFGFILNKQINVNINELLKDFPKFNAPVYMGGPVQADSLFYIHTHGEFIKESIQISDDLYWSGNFDQLKKMIDNQEIFPNEIMFFIGYSGWDFEQLEEEIKEDSWIISKLTSNSINELKDSNLWKNTLTKMGPEFSAFTTFPEDPSLN
jgi:putative transcriptional regulator